MSADSGSISPGAAWVAGSTRAQTGVPSMKKWTRVSMPIGSTTSTGASTRATPGLALS